MKKLYKFFKFTCKFILILTLLFLIPFSHSYSQKASDVNHAFHNAFIFGVDGGLTLPQTDYQSNKMGISFRGTGEYFFKTNSIHLVGLKLKVGSEQIKGEDTRGTISTQDGTRAKTVLNKLFYRSALIRHFIRLFRVKGIDLVFSSVSSV